MSFWSFLAGGAGEAVKAVGESVGAVVRPIWGDAAARDAARSDEYKAALDQFTAEFVARQQRTWWDSFVDGLNRLPRPLLTLGVVASPFLAWQYPKDAAQLAEVMGLLPDQVWWIYLTIVGFWFGGRPFEKLAKARMTKEALTRLRELAVEEEAPPPSEPEALPIPDVPKQTGPRAPAGPVVDNRLDPLRCVAATLWGEARGEGPDGIAAVAWVIRNRVARPAWWGKDWTSVCLAHAQFTCWWDAQAPRLRVVDVSDTRFGQCLTIAAEVMGGGGADPTGGADHYYADTIAPPAWARDRTPVAVIGHHRFFKLGPDGRG
jgi:spore germination cell wall hydrolase CwlJ-like protein